MKNSALTQSADEFGVSGLQFLRRQAGEDGFEIVHDHAADVLEGLIRSRRCFVVKNLIVERADAASADDASGMGSGAGVCHDGGSLCVARMNQ